MRVLAFVEALGPAGPAKDLLAVAPHLDLHLATFRRLSLGSDHTERLARFAAAARTHGVAVRVIDERSRFDWRVIDGIDKLLTSLRPDIVESHHLKSHALLALARRRADVTWAAWHHGYTRPDLKGLAYNPVDRWSLPKADIVATTCEPLAKSLEGLGIDRGRIHVIRNAVVRPRPMAKSWGRAQLGVGQERVVLAAGGLSPENGHDLLVDACGALPDTVREGLLMLVVGDGPERSRLERQARRRGVRVRFDDPRPDLSAYYAAADVFAFPSRNEGSPNLLLEAMAAAKPIVATTVGRVPDMLDVRSAILVPPDEPAALASGIGRLLAFAELADRLGRGAREAALRFGPDERAAQILSMYGTLIAPRTRGRWVK